MAKILPMDIILRYHPHIQLCPDISPIEGPSDEIVGYYQNGPYKYGITRTAMRASNFYCNDHIITLTPNGTYFRDLCARLFIPEWVPFLERAAAATPNLGPRIEEVLREVAQLVGNTLEVSPQLNMILAAFNMVHPLRIAYACLGYAPMLAQKGAQSPGLGLIYVPPGTAPARPRHAKPRSYIDWHGAFSSYFPEICGTDEADASSLAFLLAGGDILPTNISLTSARDPARNERHQRAWLPFMINVLRELMEVNPAMRIIVMGRPAFFATLGGGLPSDRIYYMPPPQNLSYPGQHRHVPQQINDALEASGLRAHIYGAFARGAMQCAAE